MSIDAPDQYGCRRGFRLDRLLCLDFAYATLIGWAFLILVPSEAPAVLIAYGDGTGNSTPPYGFDEWSYVGSVNGLSGVYLGNGWILTADHVGPGDFDLEGTTYPWLPGSDVRLQNTDGSPADLVIFEIDPYPTDLPSLALRQDPPVVGDFVVMVGYGRDRGEAMQWDPNGEAFPPPEMMGWIWGSEQNKRWGTNTVEGFPSGKIMGTVAFYTSFDADQIFPEAQVTEGDSGGALFIVSGETVELAGLLYAEAAAPGQPGGTSLFSNLSLAARIDFYYDEIQTAMAVPEPHQGLLWGLAFLSLLARKRTLARRKFPNVS